MLSRSPHDSHVFSTLSGHAHVGSNRSQILRIHAFVKALEGAADDEPGEDEEIVERDELGADGEEEELIPLAKN